jgi:hypothetical protein
MNTKTLAKHYDTLGPWERVPLICAASAQGDDLERERLARSAPKVGFRVPNFYGLIDGLRSLAIIHLMICLDLAAMFWRTEGVLFGATALDKDALGDRMERALRLLAFKLVRVATVWRSFCEGLSIDGDPFLHHLPVYEAVCRAEKDARSQAVTEEEALALLQEFGGPEARFRSISEEVDGMREYLASHLAEWS